MRDGQALQELSEDIQKKVARAATNAGAQVIKKGGDSQRASISDPALTPNIPSGYMRDSIIVRRQRQPEDKGLTSQHAVTVRHKGAKVLKDAPNPYESAYSSMNSRLREDVRRIRSCGRRFDFFRQG